VLIRGSLVEILPRLYGKIVIPSAVATELSHPAAPRSIHEFLVSPPAWLEIRTPTKILSLVGLGSGEQAAISLAYEAKDSLLLVDEKRGRRVALSMNIQIIGTIGILESAAFKGFLDFPSALKQLPTDFSIAPEIIKDALVRDKKRQQ
jgi:predicted nucleic acid-binding protein